MSNATVLMIELMVWIVEHSRMDDSNEIGEEAATESGDGKVESKMAAEVRAGTLFTEVEELAGVEVQQVEGGRRGRQKLSGDAMIKDGGAERKLQLFMAKLHGWEGVCLVCKATAGRIARDHLFDDYVRDEFLTGMMQKGSEQMRAMQEPISDQGRC